MSGSVAVIHVPVSCSLPCEELEETVGRNGVVHQDVPRSSSSLDHTEEPFEMATLHSTDGGRLSKIMELIAYWKGAAIGVRRGRSLNDSTPSCSSFVSAVH